MLQSLTSISFSNHRHTIIFHPTEPRIPVTGKVVCYLQDNGAFVEAGHLYVEVEETKTIMPIEAFTFTDAKMPPLTTTE